jgi:SAM-dependent methyltransferase
MTLPNTVGTSLNDMLARIALDYPPAQIEIQQDDILRIAFHLELVERALPNGGSIADVGGGLGLFSAGCADMGLSSKLVDDFRDLANIPIAEDIFQRVHRKRGVEIISRDVIAQGVEFPPESLDVITTFDSMEHWHNSPKQLFRQLLTALRPGGTLIIGVPNCVNIRKRITVPLGIGKWSSMNDWYEAETFRGHVREPDVDDLLYIARDLGLTDIEIMGRNWLGYVSRFGWVRRLTPLADKVLRMFPSLCSDLYLVGRKPSAN